MARKRSPKLESIHSLLCLAIALSSMVLGAGAAQAQTFTTLFSFNNSDGANPQASLIMDAQGNLYGTTSSGGTYGFGTVFKLDPSGKETVLHSFAGNLEDGGTPVANLIADVSGNLYGTTDQGATPAGGGTVFKLDPSGNETILHSFTGGSDGGNPESGLVMDAQGNFYGTTFAGGAYGFGTVFKVDLSGNETVLHSFTGGSDGYMPHGNLIMDAQRNLYGTTFSSNNPAQGNGVVFKLDPAGSETVLYTFTGGGDGAWPNALIMDAAGNLYGTAGFGGNPNCYSGQGCGTVFKVDPSGNETVLYSFTGGSDGQGPGSLIMDAQGNLYGTTSSGGAYGYGTVFRLNPSGSETVLHSFTGGNDGMLPSGGLIMDAANNLYGTTYGGGASNNCYGGCGTLFKVATQTKAASTTTSLAASLNPAATNQGVTFRAVVSSQSGGAATGTITFMAGAQILGSAPLSGNVGSLTTSFAAPGTYSITARYNGDSDNTGSTSSALSEKILAATTTTLISSLNPSAIGQAVTFKATVTSSAGIPRSGEPITFYNGTAVLGTAPLSAGAAMLTTSALPAGVFTMTARYPGDSAFLASTSTGLRQTVNATSRSATATTVASSLNPSIYGQKVTLIAQVTSLGPIPPTGTVVFMWKYFTTTYTIGTAALNSAGVATLTKSNLNASLFPIIAVYKGDTNNLSSRSPVLNQTVLQTTTRAMITSSVNPSTVGQEVTFTAKITSPTVLPSGPVTFKAGTTVLETIQLSSGKAIFTTATLPAGSTVLKVIYNGNSNIKGSSAAVTQTVQP
ncbi:MAG: choice-of-anchor tandem repeat GloVer-containing protein [Acidobacteriota bacterium]